MALVFEQMLTKGLGDASYLIGDDSARVGTVMDPKWTWSSTLNWHANTGSLQVRHPDAHPWGLRERRLRRRCSGRRCAGLRQRSRCPPDMGSSTAWCMTGTGWRRSGDRRANGIAKTRG